MALTVNPRCIQIREPNLLVPGRKPVGSVRVDWSHPLANDLVTLFIHGIGAVSVHEQKSDRLVPATFQNTAYADHKGFVAGSANPSRYESIYTTDSDIVNLNKTSPSGLTHIAKFRQYAQYGSGYGDGGYGWFNAAAVSTAFSGFKVYAKYLYAGIDIGTTAKLVSATTFNLNDDVYGAITWGDGNNTPDIYAQYHISVSTTGTSVSSISATATAVGIAGYPHSGTYYGDNVITEWAMSFNRRLPESVIKDLWRDPYQILIPA